MAGWYNKFQKTETVTHGNTEYKIATVDDSNKHPVHKKERGQRELPSKNNKHKYILFGRRM